MRRASYSSLYSPPKTCQLISTLLSAGISTSGGTVGSRRDKQKAQRHKIFQFLMPVLPFSLDNWSLAVLDNLICLTIMKGCSFPVLRNILFRWWFAVFYH